MGRARNRLAVHVYLSEEDNALCARDEFADAGVVGSHLNETAGLHFPGLLKVVTPGAFYFFGNVLDEMKQAVRGMPFNTKLACPGT